MVVVLGLDTCSVQLVSLCLFGLDACSVELIVLFPFGLVELVVFCPLVLDDSRVELVFLYCLRLDFCRKKIRSVTHLDFSFSFWWDFHVVSPFPTRPSIPR